MIVLGAALNGVPDDRGPHGQRSFAVQQRIRTRGAREHDGEHDAWPDTH